MTPNLDKKPYLIDAVIGNSRFLASLLKTGRLVRFWWPHVDFPQHADTIRSGIRMAGTDARTTWFDSAEDGWSHESGYVPRTNIYAVRASSPRYPLEVRSELYAVPGEDVLVFDYRLTNTGADPVSFSFYFYSSIAATESPFYHTTQFHPQADALVHYRHRYYFSVSSANVCTRYQACHAWEAANSGELNGDNVQMASDGALEWAFRDVAPGQTVNLTVYLAAGDRLEPSLAALEKAKASGAAALRERTARYWHAFVDSASPCPIGREDVRELYERSVLTMKLMSDEQTGSIIAAPEFDEHFSRCGGYAYCWGRDAAFITTALDKAGLMELSTRFYEWTLTAQDADGAWQQRHYHDGSLAPNWGLQIDEGSSILWGMHQHYLALPESERESFLRLVWDAVLRGAEFLVRSIDPDNGLPAASRDLWEEREGQHTYSSAAVFAGLKAAASFAALRGETELAAKWNGVADTIARQITSLCWNEEKGAFYRGVTLTVNKSEYEQAAQAGLPVSSIVDAKGYSRYRLAYDPIVDVSLLGVSVPFAVVPPEHSQAVRTADAVEKELTVAGVGGIKRYENDSYIGGNPWILTTLWLAQYRACSGRVDEARKLLDWAVRHRTYAGLLPEQVDRHTGETAWVVPLTWSHAMFILTVHLIAEASAADASASQAAQMLQ
ncbi:glycoside hydrolase family 15 protein [Cohnella thermotolerans]|uniref:glycoside hydrolase family 15 protein n=1 Tax=Cohnella thermotolerans TaxID=329858 RepID=UPI00041720EE|nr:glycoside hydrolase family 15 protein [Cohnella thermotolerans]